VRADGRTTAERAELAHRGACPTTQPCPRPGRERACRPSHRPRPTRPSPGQYDTRRRPPGAHCRSPPPRCRPTTGRSPSSLVGQPTRELERGPAPPCVHLRGRHLLCHHAVEVRHDVAGDVGRHAARDGAAAAGGRPRKGFSPGYMTNLLSDDCGPLPPRAV
jgi:hypothetical protein